MYNCKGGRGFRGSRWFAHCVKSGRIWLAQASLVGSYWRPMSLSKYSNIALVAPQGAISASLQCQGYLTRSTFRALKKWGQPSRRSSTSTPSVASSPLSTLTWPLRASSGWRWGRRAFILSPVDRQDLVSFSAIIQCKL